MVRNQSSDNVRVFVRMFIGLTTNVGQGAVDTAAEDGVVGMTMYKKNCEVLRDKFGLVPIWHEPIEGQTCSGIGGQSRIAGIADVPIGLAGINGVLRVTVIEDSPEQAIPLLLPINLQELLNVTICLPAATITFSQNGSQYSTKMHTLPSKHRTIDIFEFEPQAGWYMPPDAFPEGE